MFAHGTPNRRERSTLTSRLLGNGVMALSLTIGSLVLPGAALAASPEVRHERFEFTHEETNTNICGDWGVFRFSGTSTFTVVNFRDGVFQVARGRCSCCVPPWTGPPDEGTAWSSWEGHGKSQGLSRRTACPARAR